MKRLNSETSKNKNRAGKILKYILKGTAMLLGTVVLLYLTLLHTHNTAIADDSNAYGMKIKLLEWNRVYELPQRSFYGALVWGNGNPYYFTSGRNIGQSKNSDDRYDYWVGQPDTIDPYLDFGKEKFITRDYHDIPYFEYKGRNGSYLANSLKYVINLRPDLGHTKWVYTPKNNIVGSNSSYSVFSILDYKHDNRGTSTKNMKNASTTTSKGMVRSFVYYGEEKCAILYHSGDYISVHKKDEWPTDEFILYEVTEKEYAAMSDYTVTKGNIFVNQDSSFLLDGKTLTVEEDAVLSIKGTFYYNGSIDCAGTIILQEGATMTPYHPNNAAGSIKLRDGGTIIIMPKARLLAGLKSGTMNSTKDGVLNVENGSIINYGLLASGYTTLTSTSTLELHSGSLTYLGLNLNNKKLNAFYNNFTNNTGYSELGLDTSGGVISVYSGGLASTTSIPTVYMYPQSRLGYASGQSYIGSALKIHNIAKSFTGNYVDKVYNANISSGYGVRILDND